MDAVKSLIELLNILGRPGIWVAIVLLAFLSMIYLIKQIQGLKAGSLSVKEKKFEQLSKLVLEKDIDNKPGILLEQAFENYFGFILAADEICHILKSRKQSEAIRDLKYCRGMFTFDSNGYIYARKIRLNTKIIINNFSYWMFSICAFFVTLYAMTSESWPMLSFTIIFGLSAYLSLSEIRILSACERIQSKYYGPNTLPVHPVGCAEACQ